MSGLAAAILACPFAAYGFSAHAAKAALLVPSTQMPDKLKIDVGHAADLLARYPRDPRAHLIKGISLADLRRFSDAELELRAALALAAQDPSSAPLRDATQMVLAAVLVEQGRRGEAKIMAADICHSKGQAEKRRLLADAKLCE